MRITSEGQVTIPAHIREEAGLLPHTEVDFIHDETGIRIVPVHSPKGPGRGELLVEHLGKQRHINMSTDEIMNLTR